MSTSPEHLRRCAIVFIEPREDLRFDLGSLLSGQDSLISQTRWIALAPHRDDELELDAAAVLILGQISETPWQLRTPLEQRHGAAVIAQLCDSGLLLSDAPARAYWRERDERLRDSYWRPASAVSHYFSRWKATGVNDDPFRARFKDLASLVDAYGPPPGHFHARAAAHERLPLATDTRSALAPTLRRRLTCRNFDPTTALDATDFAEMLKNVFGMHGLAEVARDTYAVKKTSPSGGSLHAIEAYLLVQHVQGIASGLYHYHVGDHALEPISTLDAGAARELALRMVADQAYFADAHVMVVLAPRFKRSFWKYRNHPKVYRALNLDAGHLSQTLYLLATEAGLGAFVTAAINEIDIEQAFGLDPLDESPLAVCGFGIRSSQRTAVEFDAGEMVPLQHTASD